MTKKTFISLFLIISSLISYSQEETKRKPSDRLIIDLFTDVWTDLPAEMGTLIINRGIAIQALQDFPLGTSPVSIAGGLGFSSHNLYSDNRYLYEGSNFEFVPIPDGQDYKNNKLSLNYIDIPVELRLSFGEGSKKVRFHAGIKAGLLVSATAKYRGDDMPDGREIKVKEKLLDNIEPFLLSAHARLGYGRVTLFGQMLLNEIFTGNNAADASFMSVGVSYIVF